MQVVTKQGKVYARRKPGNYYSSEDIKSMKKAGYQVKVTGGEKHAK